jgi:hypothetical protein
MTNATVLELKIVYKFTGPLSSFPRKRETSWGLATFSSSKMILLKNPKNASTRLSMNGKSPMISAAPPFVLRLSKDERRIFQQNPKSCLSPFGEAGFRLASAKG